jgi:gamma-glutamyltranspeptidase/glutathione hydrolase
MTLRHSDDHAESGGRWCWLLARGCKPCQRRLRARLLMAAALTAMLTAALTTAPTPAAATDLSWQAHAPEAATGFGANTSVRASRFMAATANPHATDAAYQVLARGGSAVDAVIAAQMMLTLVEPQSSGIGGGAFLLTYQAASGTVAAWDGRETAPMAADEGLFRDALGRSLPFFSAVVGGRAVGVPGAVRMLEAAHRELGRMGWPELLQPAIDASLEGFNVSPRLHALISRDPFLRDDPTAAAYFHDTDGKPLAIGARLRNPALAQTLQALAKDGSRILHSGELASAIVQKVRGHPRNPGLLTLADLAAYQPRPRQALCSPWLRWIVCGMPPPSSGAVAVGQMLGILAALPFEGLTRAAALDADAVHLFSEAGRLAYADRDYYLGDSDYVEVPAGALLEQGYLAARAALVGERSMGAADRGRPLAEGYPERGTSHVSVVDSEGNAAALTTSIESAFGSRQMVGGFLLNNTLTDFSFDAAQPTANRLQPGKRPRSSMSPTLVFEPADNPAAGDRLGRLVMVTGSPGGSTIINYVAKSLIATLQDGLDPQVAIALPNVGSRNGPTELELGRDTVALAAALRARGHALREADMTSGVQAIVRRCRGEPFVDCAWVGAADPRREGTVRGN